MNSKINIKSKENQMSENEKTSYTFIIMNEDEENDLLKGINNTIEENDVCKFQIVKRGYGSGIWKKTKTRSATNRNVSFNRNRYSYMEITGPPPTLPSHSNYFSMCFSSDFKNIAAVVHNEKGIVRILNFPQELPSDWFYLWKGYKRSVLQFKKILYNLRVMECVLGDELILVSDFLVPVWCKRYQSLYSKYKTGIC